MISPRPPFSSLERLESRDNPATSFVDYTFGTNGLATLDGFLSISNLATLDDGSTVVVGQVFTDDVTDFAVARLTPTGQPDPTFGTNGRVAFAFDLPGYDTPVDFRVLPDGGLVVVGTATNKVAVARLSKTGELDPTFDGDGKLTFTFIADPTSTCIPDAIDVQTDGTITISGRIPVTPANPSNKHAYAVRLTSSGSFDAGYAVGGIADLGDSSAVTTVDDEGNAYTLRREGDPMLVSVFVNRFDTSGLFDTGYGVAGRADVGKFSDIGPKFSASYSVTAVSDGALLVSRNTKTGPFAERASDTYRLRVDGSLDAGFGTNGKTTLVEGEGLREGMTGQLVGFEPGGNSEPRMSLVRVTPTGNLDLTFGNNGLLPTTELNLRSPHIAAHPLDKMVVVGGLVGNVPAVGRLLTTPNELPTITVPSTPVVFHTGVSTTISFSINDLETPADALQVTATSSDSTLFPAGTVTITGTGADRVLTLTATAPLTGSAVISITVRDAFGAQTTATVPVEVINDLPTITVPSTPVVFYSGTSATVSFTIADTETPSDTLQVTATSSVPTLFPPGTITITGTGSDRVLTLSATAPLTGSAVISITVSDAYGGQTTATVPVEVLPPRIVLVGSHEFVVGPDAGGGPAVTTYNADGSLRRTTAVLQPGFTGGVRVASADFTRDGIADFVVGTGPGSPTRVEVYDGLTYLRLFTIDPFEPSFTGGVFVSAGDLNGDGAADLVVSPDQGGGPRVRVFDGATFNPMADFFGIDDPAFRGGARTTVSDLDGDGVADLFVAAGFGGGPRVTAFDGKSLTSTPRKLFADFFAFESTLRNGIFLTSGDLNGDGFADFICGGGPGGGPRVLAFDGKNLLSTQQVALANFFGGDPNSRGGIRIAVKNLDGDTHADLIVGSGSGAGSHVTASLGNVIPSNGTPPAEFQFDTFSGFDGGVFVG